MEEVFGQEPEQNALLIRYAGDDASELDQNWWRWTASPP